MVRQAKSTELDRNITCILKSLTASQGSVVMGLTDFLVVICGLSSGVSLKEISQLTDILHSSDALTTVGGGFEE